AFEATLDSHNEIYLMNADGSSPHPLTHDWLPADSYYTWSPDSQQIAFVSVLETNNEIYVQDTESDASVNLTRRPACHQMPASSPDGRQLACWSAVNNTVALYRVNADGSHLTQLSDGYVPCADDHVSLAWSADGKQIVFGMHGYTDPVGIFIVNADGGQPTF